MTMFAKCPHCAALMPLPLEPADLIGKSLTCNCGKEIKIAVDEDGDFVVVTIPYSK